MKAELKNLDQLAPEPPEQLLQAARDGALLRTSRPGPKSRWRWLAGILGAGALLAVTPPGQAATDWIAEVAGFGDPPTLPQIRTVPGSATVVAAGTLADGTPFEIVSRQSDGELLDNAICFGVDWIDLQQRAGGGACTRSAHTGNDHEPALEGSGVYFPKGRTTGPALLFGIADSGSISSLQGVVTRSDGSSDLDVSLIEVSGAPLEAVGASYPVSLFAAELSPEIVEGVRAGDVAVSVSALDEDGNQVDEIVPAISGTRPDVAMQEELRFSSRPPQEIAELESVGGVGLSKDQIDTLTAVDWEGPLLQDALDRFYSEPAVIDAAEEFKAIIPKEFGDGPPSLPVQVGGLATREGEMAYWIHAAGLGGTPRLAGVYSVDDLIPLYFGDLGGGK